MLDHDQARLYELIWLRTIASQMESAELERTTVDITAKAGSRTIDLRANGTVVKFDGFLTLYTEDQDDKADDEDANRLPQMATGENAAEARDRRDPALHRAAAALFGSLAGQAHGRARHRPALDLRLDPAGAARPRLCAARQEAPRPRGQGPRAGRVPGELLPASYVEYDFTASLEEQLDKISNNELPYKDVLRDFWKDFIGAVGNIKELRITQVIDALDEMLAPHLFPPKADGTDPRKCPILRERPDRPEARPLRRLRRLLELSGMQVHPPAHGRRRRRAAACASSARIRTPASKSPCAPAASAAICNSAKPPRTRRARR